MATVLKILCALLLVFGALATLLGLFLLLTAKLASARSPHGLNEGPALFGALGMLVGGFGCVSFLLGLALLSGLRASSKSDAESDWAREHKRLW